MGLAALAKSRVGQGNTCQVPWPSAQLNNSSDLDCNAKCSKQHASTAMSIVQTIGNLIQISQQHTHTHNKLKQMKAEYQDVNASNIQPQFSAQEVLTTQHTATGLPSLSSQFIPPMESLLNLLSVRTPEVSQLQMCNRTCRGSFSKSQ